VILRALFDGGALNNDPLRVPHMTSRRRIFGTVAQTIFLKNKGLHVTGIDLAQLLSRLLFFDEVIVSSMRMQELPFLIRAFGPDGLEELLNRGILRFSADSVSVITDLHRNGKRELPLFQFSQALVDVADRGKLISEGLQCLLQVPGLSNQRRMALSDLLLEKVLRPGPNYGADLLTQVRTDLRGNVQLVKAILVKEHPELTGSFDGLQVSLEEIQPGVQRFGTNLQKLLGVTAEREQKMLATTVLTVSKINQSLANMHEYNAISLFEDGDAPLLFGKIAGVIAPYNPKIEETAFLRVLEIIGIPEFLAVGRIDVTTLLKVRESNECREFRAWLLSTDQYDDAELTKLLTGLRARAASFIASPTGKVVRLAVNAGLGLIPGYGTFTSLAEGAVDNFLLDKLLPSSGVLSFLSQSIPSVISRG
jgi:hypothetical protein